VILRPTDVAALAWVASRHPGKDLNVSILLHDNASPADTAIDVWNTTTRDRYVVTYDGDVYESDNGTNRTTLAHRA